MRAESFPELEGVMTIDEGWELLALAASYFKDLHGLSAFEWAINAVILLMVIGKFRSLQYQARNITTGAGVALAWFTYFVADYYAALVYGFFSQGLVIMFAGGLLGYGHWLVLSKLRRARTLTRWERSMQAVVWLVPFAMLLGCLVDEWYGLQVWTWRQTIFTISASLVLVAFATQPMQLQREKFRGDLQLQTLLYVLLENTFWLGYGVFIFRKPEFILFASIAEGLIVWSIIEWFRCAPGHAPATQGASPS